MLLPAFQRRGVGGAVHTLMIRDFQPSPEQLVELVQRLHFLYFWLGGSRLKAGRMPSAAQTASRRRAEKILPYRTRHVAPSARSHR